jgi:tetratricopeptide (TPR) repeat protein
MRPILMAALLILAVAAGPLAGQAQVADIVKQKSEAAYKEYMKGGNFLAGENKYDAAVDSYRKAISMKPDAAEAYSLMGSALAMAGKDREAEEALRKAVALQPTYAEGYYHLGNFLKSTGKMSEAEDAFRKAKQYRR